uniref:Uncharacterized protein n=1 Tax=Melopsittacus undulatus TaxID=13146 RepID=A0A8C6J0L6_MELUD
MPQPVASATKQNLLMAVAITVHIAKLNSVHAVEEECLYGQIRYGVMKKSSQNQEPGSIIVDQTHHSSLTKKVIEVSGMRKHLKRKKQSCRSIHSTKDHQVTYPHKFWTKTDLKGSQDKTQLRMVQG